MRVVRQVSIEVAPVSQRDLEELAEGYLQILYPANLLRPMPLDVIAMLDRLEMKPFDIVFGVSDLPRGTEGRTDPFTRQIIIDTQVYRAALSGEGRARNTCCHEVGHIQHISQLTQILDNVRLLQRRLHRQTPVYCDPEWQANVVASALLMPRATTSAIHRSGGIGAMVETFQVSRRAAEVRAEVLQKHGWL